MKRWFTRLAGLLLLSAALPLAAQNPQKASPSAAQSQTGSLDVSSYEKRVSVKTLPNGLTVILWRRPEAPVFSFFTMVDAGSAQDPLNETGLAHMMEHMAFKGTPDIGTKDYAAEKPALEKVEQTYAAYEAERIKRVGQDQSDQPLRFDPTNPAANADGYVKTSNVNSFIEVMDMREAERSYNANLAVMQATRSMLNRTIDMLK